MRFLQDYHCHSRFSFDGQTEPEALIRHAAAAGITHLAITDHADFGRETPGDRQLADHTANFRAAQAAFAQARAATAGLPIDAAFGIEIGQTLFAPEETRRLAQALPFDVVLLSVHQIFDYPDFHYFDYRERDPLKTISEYFGEVIKSVKAADFDVLAHLFYPYRYLWKQNMDLPRSFCADAIDEILRLLAQGGKALEINVSTVYKGYPSMPPEWVLERFRELGGEYVTVGTDDHKLLYQEKLPAAGLEIAERAGFRYFAVYHGRRCEPVKFTD